MNKINIGKHINLRLVEIKDAEFILNLRLKKDEFLSATNPNLTEQENWIKSYKKREESKEEYYFIIENKDGLRSGTIRLYDFRDNSFCWGSWIIKNDSPYYFSIESVLLIYKLGFENLKFTNCHFDVRKNNKNIVSFHKRFGAKIIKENDLDYFYKFSFDDYQIAKIKYKKFLLNN